MCKLSTFFKKTHSSYKTLLILIKINTCFFSNTFLNKILKKQKIKKLGLYKKNLIP